MTTLSEAWTFLFNYCTDPQPSPLPERKFLVLEPAQEDHSPASFRSATSPMADLKSQDIATNRKARHDYAIGDTYEAGVALAGTEVKSIRARKVNIRDAFARVEKGQVFLYGCDIQPYECASHFQHEAKRPRRLLLNKKEISKLDVETSQKGCTLIVLRLYWKGQKVKVEIGVAKGKDHVDRRQSLRERTEKREADRDMAAFNRKFR